MKDFVNDSNGVACCQSAFVADLVKADCRFSDDAMASLNVRNWVGKWTLGLVRLQPFDLRHVPLDVENHDPS